MTKTEQAKSDVAALLRARNPLLWIQTIEELRAERAIVEAAGSAGYQTLLWDCATGLSKPDGAAVDERLQDPAAVLERVRVEKERRVYLLRDLHQWLRDPVILRKLRTLARELQTSPRPEARSIILLTPPEKVPADLSGQAIVIDWPLPERAEIAAILDEVLSAIPEDLQADPLNGSRDAAIDAATGLTAEAAASCYAKSIVSLKKIDPATVAGEKKRVIARETGISWEEPDPRGLDAVGGLEEGKRWAMLRRLALSQEAREYGLPAPRGVLLVGVPGCGKSLFAKAVATAWKIPLLRLDLGGLKSKYVGESEGNIRRAWDVAETVAPVVLWLDEIEKSLAGSTGPQGDGGVASDALGTILTKMQEGTSPVFVVATANNVESLPPELMRKGRFDEMFFVDLPNRVERAAVVGTTLAKHGIDGDGIDAEKIADATGGFSGAEIAALVPDAMFQAFADGKRVVRTEDILEAAKSLVPMSKTSAERIETLRKWATGRCRNASTPEETKGARGRVLDI